MGSMVLAGRYELINKIGDGGMAVVYKARDRVLNRMVAVKVLKPEYVNDAKFITNFRKESHAAASLNNSNVVNIYDVGKEGNINYIVMELVEGKPLSEIIKAKAPMDYRDVIDIARQVASGLAAAHKKGIIHRDVKPQNILVNIDGVVKIADFGIAKAISSTTIIDKTNDNIMGSVHYFSPEQARGGYVDEKSDIYSLGIVMYEMLTGEVPFDGDNPVTVALMHINDQMIAPSKLIEGIPPNLERIVLKATAKLQKNRYANADELMKALDEVMVVEKVVKEYDDFEQPEKEEINEKVGYLTGARAVPAKRGKSRKKDDYYDDYEEFGQKKKQKSTKPPMSAKTKKMIAIIVIIAVAAAAVGTCFKMGLIGPKVDVPNLLGKTIEEAIEISETGNFTIEEGEVVYNDKYEPGEICEQNPAGGGKVLKGGTVVVNLSKGEETYSVPKLVGMTKDEAKKILEKQGFVCGDITIEESHKKADTVITQSPKAGEIVKAGSTITFSVSDGKGKAQVKVPNIVGYAKEDAEAKLKEAKLKLGSISYESSDSYVKGAIIRQQTESGSKVDEGSEIDVVISNGSAGGSVSLYVDYDQAKSDSFRLTVKVTDNDGTRSVVSNAQRSKDDGGETITIKGVGKGTIKVIFDNETVMSKSVDFASGDLS